MNELENGKTFDKWENSVLVVLLQIFFNLQNSLSFKIAGFPQREVLVNECSNLVALVERMKEKFWPDWEELLPKMKWLLSFEVLNYYCSFFCSKVTHTQCNSGLFILIYQIGIDDWLIYAYDFSFNFRNILDLLKIKNLFHWNQ